MRNIASITRGVAGALVTACLFWGSGAWAQAYHPTYDLLVLRDATAKRVTFSNFINRDAVAKLRQTLEVGDTLQLEGPGGEVGSVMDLARLIRDRQVVVDVPWRCMSGCAIIYITAQRRAPHGDRAKPVFTHNSPITDEWMLEQRPELYSFLHAVLVRTRAKMFRDFLDEFEISPDLFTCANRLAMLEIDVNTETGLPPAKSKYEFIWMSDGLLTRFGAKGLPPGWGMSPFERELWSHGRPYYWADERDCRDLTG